MPLPTEMSQLCCHQSGVLPLSLTTATQEQPGCCTVTCHAQGSAVTAVQPEPTAKLAARQNKYQVLTALQTWLSSLCQATCNHTGGYLAIAAQRGEMQNTNL